MSKTISVRLTERDAYWLAQVKRLARQTVWRSTLDVGRLTDTEAVKYAIEFTANELGRVAREKRMVGKRVVVEFVDSRKIVGFLRLVDETVIAVEQDDLVGTTSPTQFYPRSLIQSMKLSENQRPNAVAEGMKKGLIRRIGS